MPFLIDQSGLLQVIENPDFLHASFKRTNKMKIKVENKSRKYTDT